MLNEMHKKNSKLKNKSQCILNGPPIYHFPGGNKDKGYGVSCST